MKLKLLFTAIFAIIIGAQAFGQTPTPTFIKGDLNIRFDTRQKPNTENVFDVYTLNLNVSNSVLLKGNITSRPFIKNTFGTNQNAQLTYDIDTDIVNPKNTTQTKNVGKILGNVPITENNVYDYTVGTTKINVFSAGNASGIDSKFTGQAVGKPPVKTGWDKVKQDAIKLVGSKGSISVTKYDKMEFQNIVLAMGPVAIYPNATVNGVLLYDYVRSAWYAQNIVITYGQDGKRMQDNITGNIRWVKDTYTFDIRVNEPPPSESTSFAAATDEADFFATDNINPSLTGIMKYKDVVSGDRIISSNVSVDLVGNQLNKQQVMYLTKMLFIVAIVPFNAE